MSAYRSTWHRDGTITYWSVFEQVWIRRASYVPPRELVTWTRAERARWIRTYNARAHGAGEVRP